MKKFIEILRDENGQGMVEYGLILGLIAIVAIGAVILLGKDVNGVFGKAQGELNKVSGVNNGGAN